jgi:hypothetical protein
MVDPSNKEYINMDGEDEEDETRPKILCLFAL